MSSRKDDPVFNVKFVQLVESKPCLWNSTLPEYSKKDEIQNAWQEVANETKDTVRNCRERWRTIRSSFLRSLKLSRTSTGRGKRKYYLSKYLQFLIPFTKARLKNSSNIIAQRKTEAIGNITPMTRISNMPTVSSDDTKDSSNSAEVAAIAEGDVVVNLHEHLVGGVSMAQHTPIPLPQPLNLQAIKEEKDFTSVGGVNTTIPPLDHTMQSLDHQRPTVNNTIARCLTSSSTNNNNNNNGTTNNNRNVITNPTTTNNNTSINTTNSCSTIVNASSMKCSNIASGDTNNNNHHHNNIINTHPPQNSSYVHTTENRSASGVDLAEFAEWIKSKNDHQRHCLMTTSPDADQSFLNSLHPYLREMSGKQNRRFRQKVVALIDAVLDNAD